MPPHLPLEDVQGVFVRVQIRFDLFVPSNPSFLPPTTISLLTPLFLSHFDAGLPSPPFVAVRKQGFVLENPPPPHLTLVAGPTDGSSPKL